MNLSATRKGVGSVANDDIQVRIKELNIDITPQVTKILEQIGVAGVADVRAGSPKNKGTYANSWDSKLENEDTVVIFTDTSKLKNTNMSTLLEKGHQSRNGSWVPPQEHIRPMYNRMKRKYQEELKRIKIQPK